MTIDLHLHTHHSDGAWSPKELVDKAIQLKLKHIAVTDHDTVDGIESARAAAAGALEVVAGIELNCRWQNGSGPERDVHVLGYFIDPKNEKLQAVMKKQQAARGKLVTDTVKYLQSLGVPLSEELVKESSGIGSIGRPHLTRAIVKAGGASNINEAFGRFMTRGSPDYIARHSITPVEAMEAIHSAGGLASIAHPGKGDYVEEMILSLKDQGLDAVEAYHRSHSLSLIKHYLKFAAKNAMLISGGSDCHGPYEDFPASIGTVRIPAEVLLKLRQAASAN